MKIKLSAILRSLIAWVLWLGGSFSYSATIVKVQNINPSQETVIIQQNNGVAYNLPYGKQARFSYEGQVKELVDGGVLSIITTYPDPVSIDSLTITSLPLPTNASKETGGNLDLIQTNTSTSNTTLSSIATNTASGSARTIIPSTAAAAIVTNIDSTSYEASKVISASPATLLGCHGYSSKSSTQYILFFNSTTVPADSTAPTIAALSVPATSTWSIDFGVYGRPFSTGIAVSNSSTANTKTIGSADSWFSCIIK